MKGKQEQKHKAEKKKKISIVKKDSATLNWKTLAMLGAIVLISFIIYVPVLHNTFLAWDDNLYIRENPLIYSLNLKDIFSTNVMGNYHPMTILMLAIEYHLFGLSETGYHAVNLIMHLMNVILVFYVLFLLCQKSEVALVASLLFGIHPIHVESVAWAAELKDLLYTFFFLLTCIVYMKYLKGLQKKYYFLALTLFLFSLLSKGMAASLPVVLLLIDFYKGRKLTTRVWLEKAPFFLAAMILGVVAVNAQKAPDIVQNITEFTFLQRIAFASYGFNTYIAKLFLPINLSAYYPYPLKNGNAIPAMYYGYIVFIPLILAALFYSLRKTKKIFFGIGFFATTVFLVLQLLPVGDAIIADRYSYVPSIGIFYLAGEGFHQLWNSKLRWIGMTVLLAYSFFFCITTNARCKIWKTDMSLWQDVIKRFQTVPVAYYNRGLAFMNENKMNEAIDDYTKAVELKPGYNVALVNRGNIFRGSGRYEEALRDYNTAIEFTPNFSIAYFNRGILYMNQQRNEDALNDFNKAIEYKPGYYKAYSNRGIIYTNLKRYSEAIDDYSKAIEFKPDYMEAYYNRGMVYSTTGNKAAACNDIRQSANLGFKTAADAIPQVCN